MIVMRMVIIGSASTRRGNSRRPSERKKETAATVNAYSSKK